MLLQVQVSDFIFMRVEQKKKNNYFCKQKKILTTMEKPSVKTNLILFLLIVLGISTRFFIHIPNFTAIGAIALFSGAWFSNKKLAIVLPFLLLFITDAIIGFHNTMPFVYFSFLLIILIGFYLRTRKNPVLIFAGSLAGSILFYLITNFGVWMMGMGLSENILRVYIDGIPFFRNTLAGDLCFNTFLFSSAYLLFKKTSISPAVNDR